MKYASTGAPVTRMFAVDRQENLRRALEHQGTKVGSNLATALESVWSNRLRSLLTTLGIVIGIAAVISVVTLSQGVNAFFLQQFAHMGTTVLTVQPASSGNSNGLNGPTLTTADITRLAKLPHVLGVSPVLSSGGQIVYGANTWTTDIEGVSTFYQSMNDWTLSEGHWWSQSDEQLALPVIVLGQTVLEHTFGVIGSTPIGRTVRVNGQLYRVVGVLTPRGDLGSTDQDDIAFVPYTNLLRFEAALPLTTIQIQADSVSNVNLVQLEATLALERDHSTAVGSPSGFIVNTPQQLIDQQNRSQAALENLLIGLAAISLAVGGIGIMNMMIVSVTERTREIGLRVAVGAQPSDIRNQFLVEALLLCVIGGGIAVPFGLGLGYVLTAQFHFPFVPSVSAIMLAIGVAAAVGISFGFYPALRAARLDPIAALRSE